MTRFILLILVFICGCATTVNDLNQQGITLANEKQYAQALQKFLEAHRKQPNRFENCLNVAQMYILLKEPQQAIVYIDKALVLNAKELDIHLLKMQVLFLQGKEKQAVALLDSLLNRKDPRLYSVLLSLGDSSLQQQKWERSCEWYQKAIDFSPEKEQGYIALSRALIFRSNSNQGNYDNFLTSVNARDMQFKRAKAALRKAIYLNRDSLDAHLMLGMIAMQTKEFVDARTEFSEALRIDSENLIALTAASFNESLSGNHEKSTQYLEKARKIHPDRAEPLFLKANLAIQQRKFDIAVLAYTTIWKQHPQLRSGIVENFRINFSDYFEWLVELIEHQNEEVATFSLDMLREITKQDFTRNVAEWQIWYKEKGKYETQKN